MLSSPQLNNSRSKNQLTRRPAVCRFAPGPGARALSRQAICRPQARNAIPRAVELRFASRREEADCERTAVSVKSAMELAKVDRWPVVG
jgi:hypothetical protein